MTQILLHSVSIKWVNTSALRKMRRDLRHKKGLGTPLTVRQQSAQAGKFETSPFKGWNDVKAAFEHRDGKKYNGDIHEDVTSGAIPPI